MPVLLRVFELQGTVAPKVWRLLRVLLVRFCAVSVDPVATRVLHIATNFYSKHHSLSENGRDRGVACIKSEASIILVRPPHRSVERLRRVDPGHLKRFVDYL